MARYFAPGEHITYDDYLSLRAELFGELETYLHERFNIVERLEDLERDVRDVERVAENTGDKLRNLEEWVNELDRESA